MKYLLIIISIFTIACSDELRHSTSFNYDIAIDGFISTERDYVSVFLHQPILIGEGSNFKSISDAEVRLLGNDSIYRFVIETDSWDGDYFVSEQKIKGITGNVYTLEVHYAGKTFTSTDTMPQPPNDDYYLPFYKTDYTSNPMCNEHNFGYESTNVWNFNGQLSSSINRTFRNSSVSYTHRGSIPQGALAHTFRASGQSYKDDHLWLYKAEISQQHEEYLRAKYNETYWHGNMFSTQPANIPNNCSEGAVGFFYALNVSYKRIHKDELVIIEE